MYGNLRFKKNPQNAPLWEKMEKHRWKDCPQNKFIQRPPEHHVTPLTPIICVLALAVLALSIPWDHPAIVFTDVLVFFTTALLN